MQKSDKAKLMFMLERVALSTPLSAMGNVILVDGMFLIHTLEKITLTFGGLAMQIQK